MWHKGEENGRGRSMKERVREGTGKSIRMMREVWGEEDRERERIGKVRG